MLIRFTITVEVERDELTDDISEGLDGLLSDMEDIANKAGLNIDDYSWEEL
jgi:hypothetical protein